MRYTELAVGLATAAALALGCADARKVARDPTGPTLEVATAETTQVIQAARGSGHFTVAGELRTLTFNARRHADGTVAGEWEVIARQVDRIVHGTITCMTVLGSAAWLGGLTDRDNSGETTGAEVVFRTVDLAQAPGGSQDLVSLVQPSFTPGVAQNYCAGTPAGPPLNPTQQGEIVITEPGSMSFTSSVVIPISIDVPVPCALNGAGETVSLSGELHALFHFTDDGAGGFHVSVESNPQGVTGIGLTSGDQYQGTGVEREGFHAGAIPFTTTYVNNFRIIGQGSGNNLLIHETFHVTVNANGDVTAVVESLTVECQ